MATSVYEHFVGLGSTPVRSACFMTHLDIVQYLVDHGADIQKGNYNGGTCLINSVQSVELCVYLLNKGAEVNAKDIQYKTALHYAIQVCYNDFDLKFAVGRFMQ